MPVDLFLRNAAQLLTLEGGGGDPPDRAALGLIEDGAVAVEGEEIVWVGPTASVPPEFEPTEETQVFNAEGLVAMPGLVDSHTHLIWAGSRADDFERRLKGQRYDEIAAAGGGIMTTVRATREATLQALAAAGLDRLDAMTAFGVTTAEVKSGYGLDLESEIKMLETVSALGDLHPIDLIPTFLGAHTVPAEYRDRRAEYVDLVVEQMLPEVARRKLALFCDVFVEEEIAFTVEEARRILEAARAYGLFPKLHVEQLRPGAGAELAAQLKAVSTDHLEYVSDSGIAALAHSGVVGVLLPGASFFLGEERVPPVRKLRDAGVELAIASDCNPGTCPTESLPLCGTIACLRLGMTPAEVVRAMTLGGAKALGLDHEIGSLRAGKKADILLLDTTDYRDFAYHFGVPMVSFLFKRGQLVIGEEE